MSHAAYSLGKLPSLGVHGALPLSCRPPVLGWLQPVVGLEAVACPPTAYLVEAPREPNHRHPLHPGRLRHRDPRRSQPPHRRAVGGLSDQRVEPATQAHETPALLHSAQVRVRNVVPALRPPALPRDLRGPRGRQHHRDQPARLRPGGHRGARCPLTPATAQLAGGVSIAPLSGSLRAAGFGGAPRQNRWRAGDEAVEPRHPVLLGVIGARRLGDAVGAGLADVEGAALPGVVGPAT